jgi:type III pantothenate kinase
MFAAVDVGNTQTKLGFVQGDDIEIHTFPSEYASIPGIENVLKKSPPEKAVVCSVNPLFSDQLENTCRRLHIPVYYADHTNIPLNNLYSPPEDVGSDRLVTAYAVLKRFERDAIIVDMGTAVTFEVVKKGGDYLGGVIFPGIELLRKSLKEKTALLPLIELAEKEYPAVADNTQDAIGGGIFWGLSFVVKGIVDKIQDMYKGDFLVCITGGAVPLFEGQFPKTWEIVPHISIQGLIYLEKELNIG